jgi:hypothetical protein
VIILDRFTYLSGCDADPGIEVSDPYLDSALRLEVARINAAQPGTGSDGRSMLARKV